VFLFQQAWLRRSATLRAQWGTPPAAELGRERPGFTSLTLGRGVYTPESDAFVSLDEDTILPGVSAPLVPLFPGSTRRRRLLLSWLVLAACAAGSITAQLGLLLARTQFQVRGHNHRYIYIYISYLSVSFYLIYTFLSLRFDHCTARAAAC